MKIERDRVIFRSGIRHGLTLGSPITLEIENLDWPNWQQRMSVAPEAEPGEAVTLARPGHADLPGAIKYGHEDIRNVIERSSARETAARVAVGAVCQVFLQHFGVQIQSHVLAIGDVGSQVRSESTAGKSFPAAYWEQVEQSPVRCGDMELAGQMVAYIQACKRQGETCGGVFEVIASGVPIGLGSYSQWDRRLSAKLAQAVMSIPSVKGVEIGDGFASSQRPGSQVHDVIRWQEQHDGQGIVHLTNNAGGIEGGISNGEPIIVRAAVKPIASLAHPLPTVDLQKRENVEQGRYERSDVCVVPAAGVVGEAVVAIALTEAWLEKFGGDTMRETQGNVRGYRELERTSEVSS